MRQQYTNRRGRAIDHGMATGKLKRVEAKTFLRMKASNERERAKTQQTAYLIESLWASVDFQKRNECRQQQQQQQHNSFTNYTNLSHFRDDIP